jgi:hypothetical protein
MSGFPNFSNIVSHVNTEFDRRRNNPIDISKLNCWVRIASGVGNGLVLISNPNFKLFAAAGQNISSIYGSTASSGTIGTTWGGGAVNVTNDSQIGLPKPNVTSFEVDEGSGAISRKASLTITAYTKAQLEEITKYFLEPGFTVFLEWGWNTPNGVAVLGSINETYVTRVLKAKTIAEDRQNTGGHYESYLGFITGGSISFNGNAWEVGINLTGYPELPAYLQVTDNPKENSDTEIRSDLKFKTIALETDLNKKRFKQMFNELPSIRRTIEVQSLLNDPLVANAVNFINFDEKVREKINDNSDGTSLFGFTLRRAATQGEKIPVGTEIIGIEKFIRFGTLMKIINTFGSATGFKAGGETLQIQINTENTPIAAFEKIFSTEKSHLIIPNPKTPKFDIKEAAEKGSVSPGDAFTNCSIEFDTTTVQFPQSTGISGGVFNGKAFFYDNDATIVKFNKNANEWGYLDDLYVNFDFATSIMDTSKFDLKDALYQILNGMSSAVNGLWNFQIQELPKANDAGLLELRVIDLNMVGKSLDGTAAITELNLYGANSIFMDASFDMDIGGDMMNQIIGKRLSTDTNQSSPTTKGKLFAVGLQDKILNKIEFERKDVTVEDDTTEGEENPEEAKEAKEKNLEQFFLKTGIYPQVKLNAAELQFNGDLDKQAYFISYEDKELFNAYKTGADSSSGDNVSILLPIKFTFTVHGISGIKRGDKFVVNGLPDKYGKENGFFQVLSIKHVVDGMIWKTTVEGGFRQIRTNS